MSAPYFSRFKPRDLTPAGYKLGDQYIHFWLFIVCATVVHKGLAKQIDRNHLLNASVLGQVRAWVQRKLKTD